MGTRSRIGVMHGDVCKSVYCHWDGYLDHNGRILQEHYDSAQANHLVALGDISSLGTKIGDAHPFSKFEISNESPDFDKLMATHEQAEKEGRLWSSGMTTASLRFWRMVNATRALAPLESLCICLSSRTLLFPKKSEPETPATEICIVLRMR